MNESFADAVVVAAGSSQRMGGIDKLEADLAGRPLLAWSLAAMAAARSVRRIIVVAAEDRLATVRHWPWLDTSSVTLVAGGRQRSDSVLAGLRSADADTVLVHDGARPLVTSTLIDAVAAAAAEHGAAIPIVPVADSLKATADGRVTAAIERAGLAAAQTPQAARRALLLDAFAAAGGKVFTDEASLLQANGVDVVTIAGETTNIKVTWPADLALARALASGRADLDERTGFGQDSHQFGRSDGLRLGGLLIENAPRLHGHSDGDVVLHALTTALLAAIGAGDIGRLFPAGAPETAGASSVGFVQTAMRIAAEASWRPVSASLAIVAARPRLGGQRIDDMRSTIAGLLGVDVAQVSVTASSGNLSGAEGRGLAVSASGLVKVVRV
jgi:2-C-methyl-D-erythritol 4-phosphate cytidylyltransferase/2-C-methyl-D-erythritol 2,4-cyclodiphosphate synthase